MRETDPLLSLEIKWLYDNIALELFLSTLYVCIVSETTRVFWNLL